MKRALKTLFAALCAWYAVLQFRREWARQVRMPWPVPPDGQDEPWTPEDAATLNLFLRGPNGSRVMAMLRRHEYDTAVMAVNNSHPQGRDYACGYASGFRSCAAAIITLSAAQTVSEQSADGDLKDEDSIGARYAS